jgi:anthranilate phosphoribosyltransferase
MSAHVASRPPPPPTHTHTPGAVADALNLNAGVALAAAQVASSPAEGVAMAQEAQRAGKPAVTLKAWVEVSQREAARESAAAAAPQPVAAA